MRHNRPDPEVDLSRTPPASHLEILTLKTRLTRRAEIEAKVVCRVLARLEDLEHRLAEEMELHRGTRRALTEATRNLDSVLRRAS